MKKIFYLLLSLLLVFIVFLLINVRKDIDLEQLKSKYSNEHSSFVEVDGMQVHYRDEGNGETIVLLHGTGASLHTWDQWTKSLQKDHRVIRMDLPAFGLTGPHPDGNYQIKYYADFLDRFLAKINVSDFHIAGNSLGGKIAFVYAAEHGEKVKTLGLIDPAGFMKDKIPAIIQLAKTPIINELVRYITPEFVIKQNLEEVYYDDKKVSQALIEQYHDLTLRTGNRDAFIDRAKTEDSEDYSERLRRIENETLILWGKQDSWIPVEHGQLFLDRLPNAELQVIDKCGHVPMEESPILSLNIYRDFLARVKEKMIDNMSVDLEHK